MRDRQRLPASQTNQITEKEMMAAEGAVARDRWASYLVRYRNRDRRPRIFRDMVLDEARKRGRDLTFLDIGCGKGFDNDIGLQKSLAEVCRCYIGIEPDTTLPLGAHIRQVHRCTFAEAELESCSIDIAFAVMVLEHIANPDQFWKKLREVLADGGVFWGFTVDARHFFCTVSRWMERLKVKDLYLTMLKGRRGVERYENYPTYYRANTPQQIRRYAGDFSRCEFISFSRVGELNHYIPRWLRPPANAIERRMIACGRPGSTLAVRLQK